MAERGNIYVEQFYRDDVSVVKNIMYDCLSKMNVEGNHIEPIMRYINEVTDEAIGNIGATKLFDLMFTVIRYSSMKGDARKIMIDEMNVIDLDDYGDNKSSRYINYLKEMAIYNNENQ